MLSPYFPKIIIYINMIVINPLCDRRVPRAVSQNDLWRPCVTRTSASFLPRRKYIMCDVNPRIYESSIASHAILSTTCPFFYRSKIALARVMCLNCELSGV
jgi:hypothetical protein